MGTKEKRVDLIAYKDGQRIAFEIETGKNSKAQVLENIEKCLRNELDKLYLVATNKKAYEKIRELLVENDLVDCSKVCLEFEGGW